MIKYTTNKGESLIEVLVASLVLAVGILGCLQLQTVSFLNLRTASDYSMAAIAVDAISNKLRSYKDKAKTGYFQYDSRQGTKYEFKDTELFLKERNGYMQLTQTENGYDIYVKINNREVTNSIYL